MVETGVWSRTARVPRLGPAEWNPPDFSVYNGVVTEPIWQGCDESKDYHLQLKCIYEYIYVVKLYFNASGTSLMVQWLRLRASSGGARVQSLIRELDPTCCN